MKINMIGSFIRNHPFGTEIAFAKGLVDIGVDVGMWDPSRKGANYWHSSPDAVIMFKDHGDDAREAVKICKAQGAIAIEYQPDDIRAPGIRDMMGELSGLFEYVFTFDASGAKIAESECGFKKARKLLVTADPELYHPIDGVEKDIDFCFIGSLSNPQMHKSRNRMVCLLSATGHNVFAQGNFDPVQINVLYNRSKIVLNHATDVGQDFGWGYGYQCRHFEAGFAGSCLYTNSFLDDESDGPRQFCTFNSEEDLITGLDVLLEGWYDGPMYRLQSEQFLQELMEGHTPVHRAHEIVRFIEEVRDAS